MSLHLKMKYTAEKNMNKVPLYKQYNYTHITRNKIHLHTQKHKQCYTKHKNNCMNTNKNTNQNKNTHKNTNKMQLYTHTHTHILSACTHTKVQSKLQLNQHNAVMSTCAPWLLSGFWGKASGVGGRDLIHHHQRHPADGHGAGVPCKALHTLWQPISEQCTHQRGCDEGESHHPGDGVGHLVVSQSHADEGGEGVVVLDRGPTQQLQAGVAHRDQTQQTVPGGEVRLLLVLLHLVPHHTYL